MTHLDVKPCIAKSWMISDDGLHYEFNLRNDVFFHDHEKFVNGKGRKVTASGFCLFFNEINRFHCCFTGGWLFNGKVDRTKPFEAVNDTTFRINLKVPFHPMLGMLTLQYCSVVPKEIVEFYGKDFRSHPVGTGPFQLVRWEESNVLVLKRNNNYFETDCSGNKLPYLEGVRISFIADKGTEFLQFRKESWIL